MNKLLICLMAIILSSCYFSKKELTGGDIRLWKDTPVWNLAKAVQTNDTTQISQILVKEKLPIDYQEPKYGHSLLYWAVWNNNVDMVHFLLAKGANPNLHIHFNGESPVILSCKYSETDTRILSLLLHYGGNPNDYVEDEDSVTYEHSKNTPLTAAARTSLLRTQILIDAGANIEMAMKAGATPLYWATLGNHFDIVKYLLESGADYHKVYSVTNKGDTLRFTDMLARFPYRDTEENKEYLRQIREFTQKSENN